MRVYIESRDFKKTVAFSGNNLGQLMKKLGLSPENFVMARNGEIALEDERLKDGDKIRLFPVISGG